MAMTFLGRTLIKKSNPNGVSSIFSRSFTAKSQSVPLSSSSLLRLRSLVGVTEFGGGSSITSTDGLRCFSTRTTVSSMNDQSPTWNNRPPKETILLDGCDFEHWLIVVDKPEGEPTRDEIIDHYIKIVASVVGSEEEARNKIYSVSTRHYYAIGVIVSEEMSYKFKEMPNIRWVLPDSYLNVREKDYGGEPFINGQALPYDPIYHEEWVRNNARANERSRRNDRPRNTDRSRNFERRRENMQSRDFNPPQSGGNRGSPPPGQGPPMAGGHPGNMGGGHPPPQGGIGQPPPQGVVPPQQYANAQNQGSQYGMPPPNNYNGGPPRNASPGGGYPNPGPGYNAGPGPNPGPGYNAGPGPNPGPGYNAGPGPGPNPGYANAVSPSSGQYAPPNAGVPYQNNGGAPYQNNQYQNSGAGGQYQNNGGPGAMPNREYQNNYAPPPPPPNRNNYGPPGNNAYQVTELPGRDQ